MANTGTFRESARALRGVLQSANTVVPCVVPMAVLLAGVVIAVTVRWSTAMVAVAILLVFFVSVFVYGKSQNYGEAALALVAGLLTVYTVEWTAPRFAVFVFVWVGFSLFVLIIASVRLAAEEEDLFLQASTAITASKAEAKTAEAELREIAKSNREGYLGPIEAAEVVRLLAMRNLPVGLIGAALRNTERMTVITKSDHVYVAGFVADLFAAGQPSTSSGFDQLLDDAYVAMRQSRGSPDEYMRAFERAKRHVLSGGLELETVIGEIGRSLDSGFLPDEVEGWIADHRLES